MEVFCLPMYAFPSVLPTRNSDNSNSFVRSQADQKPLGRNLQGHKCYQHVHNTKSQGRRPRMSQREEKVSSAFPSGIPGIPHVPQWTRVAGDLPFSSL